MVQFSDAFCTSILQIYQYEGIFRRNLVRSADPTPELIAGCRMGMFLLPLQQLSVSWHIVSAP